MRLGFTGTRNGMNTRQQEILHKFLRDIQDEVDSFHHGDCIGADEQAHILIRASFGFPIHIHPPVKSSYRAFCIGDVVYAEKDFIARNHDIVDVCTLLIVAPFTMEQINRSGTWATARYAKRLGRRIRILWPDA